MAIKIDEAQCRSILNDEPEVVHENYLGKLYADLALSNEPREMYRIQGAISLLVEIMGLKEKALKQLENN